LRLAWIIRQRPRVNRDLGPIPVARLQEGCPPQSWLSKVLAERNFCSIGSLPIELVPLLCLMNTETHCGTRRHQRISLPNGMSVAWYGGGDQQVSRVKTLGMGGVFLSGSRVKPVGTSLRLVFQVPGGIVQAEAVVRSVSPGEGMGVEFTNMNPQDRDLLERLLRRLLS
jgi:PilZ domain